MGNALNALLRWMGRAACQYLRRSLLPTVCALSDLNFCFMALIGILFFSSAANWAHYYITSHIESTALGCNLEHGRGHFAGAASQFRKSTQ
jgi:hypothetical protein